MLTHLWEACIMGSCPHRSPEHLHNHTLLQLIDTNTDSNLEKVKQMFYPKANKGGGGAEQEGKKISSIRMSC